MKMEIVEVAKNDVVLVWIPTGNLMGEKITTYCESILTRLQPAFAPAGVFSIPSPGLSNVEFTVIRKT